MPRTLPWATKAATPAKASPKKSAKAPSSSSRQQKSRAVAVRADDEGEDVDDLRRRAQVLSSSPVPSPPNEELMIEGVDNDDLYRMVEDELLVVAQKFTTHLHAAEYKRYQREVQSRKAQTINNISRPSVGPPSDATKRKLERIQQTKDQTQVLDEMLGDKRRSASDDDTDEGTTDLPYAGTMLHGLMDSPRKRVKTLSAIIPKTTISRSAAGFTKPTARSQTNSYELPKNRARRESEEPSSDETLVSSPIKEKSEVPLPPPKSGRSPKVVRSVEAKSERQAHLSIEERREASVTKRSVAPAPASSTVTSTAKSADMEEKGPRISRFGRAKQLKEQKERDERKGNAKASSMDSIPTFL